MSEELSEANLGAFHAQHRVSKALQAQNPEHSSLGKMP